MPIARGVAAAFWLVGWSLVFWVEPATRTSILGGAGALAWIVLGAYFTITGRWHEAIDDLRWHEVRAAMLYLAAIAPGVVALVTAGAGHLPPAPTVALAGALIVPVA